MNTLDKISPQNLSKFAQLLDESYEWPCQYLFKFVLKSEHMSHANKFFEVHGEISVKESAKGNYTSITYKAHMESASHVIDFYQKVSVVPSIISL